MKAGQINLDIKYVKMVIHASLKAGMRIRRGFRDFRGGPLAGPVVGPTLSPKSPSKITVTWNQ